ncbi:MAG: spermidine synthase [Thermodesulfobacteriota bacterium]|jgi:spermidine synthase|nr:spermidine synthase [Thermodesulfobacteriota bacterium]
MKANKLLYVLFFFSGVAGLGYEILWTRMLSVGLGHEIVGMLGVVSAFFSGIALGAWFFDRPVSLSRTPARWYAGFELAIGLWALALVFLIPGTTPTVSSLIGLEPSSLRHWGFAFFYPFLLLLPATAAMGGTLPAMERLFAQLRHEKAVAGLYSANTFGAMAGILTVTFFILPALGMTDTSLLLAGLNILGAVGVLVLNRRSSDAAGAAGRDEAQPAAVGRLYLILFGTGLLGIGYEVLMVRVLSQVLENTIFSFAALLIAYLFGTALGAALYQCLGRKVPFESTLVRLLQGTALCCLGSFILLPYAAELFTWLQSAFGRGFEGAISAELILALLVLLLPTTAMGATFSHLAQHLRRSDGGIGRALSLNTLGGALAPILFGLWLVPGLGLKPTLLLVAAGYLLLLPAFRRRDLPLTAALAAAVAVLFFTPFAERFVTVPAGETLVSHREGIMASVSVLEDEGEHRYLKVNNHYQMGGTRSMYTDLRQAHLPLLLHAKPQSALFLGLGTGITFAAAADYPGLEADGVELLPEVIEALPHFEKGNGALGAAQNLRIIEADARRYVSVNRKRYDVIIADLFHPARDGAGSLYTVEHFAAISKLLHRDGLFCQWLPLHQLDMDTLKVIMRTFLHVFPEGQAYLANYSLQTPLLALVGSREPLRYPEKWFRQKLRDEEVRRRVLPLKYDSFYSLFGTFLAGDAQLRKFSAAAPLNTDEHPVVLFRAPRFVYGDPAQPHARLMDLVTALSPADPDAILAPYVTEEDYLARERLAAYWRARDSFLRIGGEIEQTGDLRALYEQVREPLLTVVRESVDFSAAYFPLLTIAYEMYPLDRDASYLLLSDLMRANPMRREAYALRERLFAETAK